MRFVLTGRGDSDRPRQTCVFGLREDTNYVRVPCVYREDHAV